MKKRVFSGLKPTGILHLGNYIGALSQWVALQEGNDAMYCIVDLHALTVRQDPHELRQRTLETFALYQACGITPKKSLMFVQSQVHEHAELCWILNTITKMSELKLMHQFKDKSKSASANINVGLFDYPVLMAADILLYDTDCVPVGEDQLQHVELAREIARRFNALFGETFVVPQGVVRQKGARIMALDNPTKKMEKTGSPHGYIALTDTADVVCKKIKSAVTDSGADIIFDEKEKPALANLLTIYHALSGREFTDIEGQYQGKGYKQFKDDLADVIVNFLKPIQEKFSQIMDNTPEMMRMLEDGVQQAKNRAEKKMNIVKERIGLVLFK